MNPLPDPAADLSRALAETLGEALDAAPHRVPDPGGLAHYLAGVLSVRLAAAVAAAGGTAPGLARALARSRLAAASNDPSVEDRVLAVLTRHPGGRDPGMTPNALTALTGLPPGVLGPAVSAMVQAGDLVRNAWLVRLPTAEDLLPATLAGGEAPADELRHAPERRAIGDRRAVGERRLFERRAPR